MRVRFIYEQLRGCCRAPPLTRRKAEHAQTARLERSGGEAEGAENKGEGWRGRGEVRLRGGGEGRSWAEVEAKRLWQRGNIPAVTGDSSSHLTRGVCLVGQHTDTSARSYTQSPPPTNHPDPHPEDPSLCLCYFHAHTVQTLHTAHATLWLVSSLFMCSRYIHAHP